VLACWPRIDEEHVMTKPSAAQREFLRKRRVFIAAWSSIGPVLVGGLLIFMIAMLLTAPMFLNPLAVIVRLRAGTLDLTTLQTMAMMLPVVFMLLCLTLLLLIVQTYRSCKREKHYLLLTDQLQ
jgi:magnesium-transporting ATPase (P-type)